jgi:cell division protease FtsH
MKEHTPSKRPIIYYAVVAAIMLLLLNALVFPGLLQAEVKEVGYNEFLSMVEKGEVTEVARDEAAGTITFTTGKDSTVQYYKTGIWPDDTLVDRLNQAGVQFSASIPTQASPLISFLVSWVLPILFFVWIGRFMMKRMQSGPGGLGNALSFGKANAKIYVEAQTGKTFEDVAGQDEAKEALLEIVDFLHNPNRYADIGAKLPKGALLVGPPGTGKTLLAKAVAGEANVPFFSISGSEFVEMFVGMGAAKVRDLFSQAEQKAPCIVFIDEIDTIGKRRDSGLGSNDEREQTLNQLLTEMDGFDARKGVVILAATNRPDSLDPALLRPGRFDRRIHVELPDLKGRTDILRVHARGVKIDPNVDFEAVARATSGASGADLANIINEAALRAVRLKREIVEQSDLEESVEVVIAGYARKNAVISPKEKRIVAYHEIGHALVAAKQTDSAPVHKITIVPRTSGALGYTMQVDESEHYLMTKEEAENKIATLTGGRAAEEIVFGSVTTGASNDIEQATRIARAMVVRYGMSGTFGMVALECQSNPYLGGDNSLTCSSDTAAKVDAEIVTIVEAAHQKALTILRENEGALHTLAEYLLERETITGEEFLSLLRGLPEPKTPLLNA